MSNLVISVVSGRREKNPRKAPVARKQDDFRASGPAHLDANAIDWNKPEHYCAIMACLVQATYVLETDRKRNLEHLAPAWWASFGFTLENTFVDDKNSSIFGAIYKNTRYNEQTPQPQAPRFVIAFRGTMLDKANIIQDLRLDLLVSDGGLGSTSRLKKAMQYVESHISEFGSEGIFLAGHSLGSSMAMLVGAKMATNDIYLKTFLFNLPSCLTDEKTYNRIFACGILAPTSSILTTGSYVGIVLPSGIEIEVPLRMFFPLGTNPFSLHPLEMFFPLDIFFPIAFPIFLLTSLLVHDLSKHVLSLSKRMKPGQQDQQGQRSLSFSPHIFVNRGDPICKNWVKYFRNQLKKKKISLFRVAGFGVFLNSISRSFRVTGFVESGILNINSTRSRSMLEAHGLKQWWQQDLQLDGFDGRCDSDISILRHLILRHLIPRKDNSKGKNPKFSSPRHKNPRHASEKILKVEDQGNKKLENSVRICARSKNPKGEKFSHKDSEKMKSKHSKFEVGECSGTKDNSGRVIEEECEEE